MNNLPTASPAEILTIAPENLEIANTYLQLQDIARTAEVLDISTEMVAQTLSRREIKAYIDSVFFDVGFNNKFKIRSAMDALIAKKFEELEEAGIGSNKDIADLLTLSHKMTMEYLEAQIKLEKVRSGNKPQSQVNLQLNEFGSDGSRYGNLIEKLLKGDNI